MQHMQTDTYASHAETKKTESDETMDAKKLAGMLLAAGLSALVAMNASPGVLAMIDVGLIGLLYVLRTRRQPEASRPIRRAVRPA